MNRLLVFLLGALAGIAALSAVRFLSGGETARGPGRTITVDDRGSDDAPGPARPDRGSRSASSSSAPRQPSVQASPPAPEPAAAAGTITGSIRFADGTPAEGVVVRATAASRGQSLYRRGGPPSAEKSFDARVQEFVKGLEAEKAARRETTSDSAGRYQLEDLGKSSYRIEAWLDGYDLEPARRAWSVRAGSTLDFVAKPIVRIPVNVLLADGSQPDSAELSMSTESFRTSHPWSAATAELACAPGTWMISAIAGDEQQYRSDAQDVTVRQGVPPQPLVFQLKQRNAIKGYVLGVLPEDPFDSVRVHWLRYAGDEPDDARVLSSASTHADTRDGGSFSILDVDEGTYVLGLARTEGPGDESRKLVARVRVDVKGLVRQNIQLPAEPDGPGIQLWVLAPDGTPLSDPRLTIMTTYDGGSTVGPARARKRPDGSLWLAAPNPKKRRSGAVDVLHVGSQRHGEKRIELDWARDTTVTVKFDDPVTLEVTLENWAGSRHQGRLSVNLMQQGKGGSAQSTVSKTSGQISPEGKQVFTGLQPGTYEVSLFASSGQWSISVITKPVTLSPGRNTVSLTIPALFKITVTADPQYRDAYVSARATDPVVSLTQRLDDEGQCVFEAVLPGDYKFTISSSKGSGSKQVTVGGDTVVRFDSGDMTERR